MSAADRPERSEAGRKRPRQPTVHAEAKAGSSPRQTARHDRPFFSEFGELEIAVISRRDEDGETLIRELQRTRARVRHIWPMPEQLPLTADVIFCELSPDLAERQPWLPGEPRSALVVIVRSSPPVNLRALHDSAPDAVLHHPITPQAVTTSLVVGRANFLYQARLRGRIEKLDDNLRTMRSVERAKSILMQNRGISEEEAYHFLRRQAMERRVSIGALASAVVDSQELLG